jgi:hypothetical protein
MAKTRLAKTRLAKTRLVKTRRFGPTVRIGLTGKVEIARTPTQDELEDVLGELMKWQGQQALASPAGGMPRGLYLRLRQLLEWQTLQQPWSWEQIHLMRWSYVREGLDRGEGWDGAYDYAERELRGTPASAGPEAMKKSYDAVQRRLPPERRRPRMYRKRKALR